MFSHIFRIPRNFCLIGPEQQMYSVFCVHVISHVFTWSSTIISSVIINTIKMPHGGKVVGQHDDDDHSGSRCFVEAEQVAKSFLNLSQMLGLTSAPDIGLLSTIVIISITRPMPAFVQMGQG